jgi:putative endonuclease
MLGLGAAKPVGFRGEDAAAEYLRRAGYTILDRNVRVPMGEADIVARQGGAEDGVIVLVEVKTRVVDPDVPKPKAEAQVGAFKRRKLLAILNHLVKSNGWERRRKRVDVVAVEYVKGDLNGEPVVRHLVNAVRP